MRTLVRNIAIAALLSSVALVSGSRASEGDWIVLVSAFEVGGAWGHGVGSNYTEAALTAFAICKAKPNAREIGCGAIMHVARNEYSVILDCGEHRIAGTGEKLDWAEQNAKEALYESLWVEGLAMPECTAVVVIDPAGNINT